MPTPTPAAYKYNLTGSNPVRSYLWSKLQSELGWNKLETGNLIPITVPQQQPQFNQYTAPYIVYKWSLMPSGEDFLMREEQIAFTIFSSDEEDIRQATSVIDNFLNRYDESARDINQWISFNGRDNEKKFDYKYTYVISASGPQPAASEAGRMDGMVIVRVCYTMDLDEKGLRR